MMDIEPIMLAGPLVSGLIAAALAQFLTMGREREAEWRKLKFSQYEELLVALSGIVEGRETAEAHVRYADACNSLNLTGSSRVLKALHDLQAYTRRDEVAKTLDHHDEFLSVLVQEMRADLYSKAKRDVRGFRFHLIMPPKR